MKRSIIKGVIWVIPTMLIAYALGFSWNVKLISLLVLSGLIDGLIDIFMKDRSDEA